MKQPRAAPCWRRALALCLLVPTLPCRAIDPVGDAHRGEQVYQRCMACHALEYDRVGPRLCGLLGRRAGSLAGFDYSQALVASGVTWERKSLDAFLADPGSYIEGVAMPYAGVKAAADRADLIAFLAVVADDPARCLSDEGGAWHDRPAP